MPSDYTFKDCVCYVIKNTWVFFVLGLFQDMFSRRYNVGFSVACFGVLMYVVKTRREICWLWML